MVPHGSWVPEQRAERSRGRGMGMLGRAVVAFVPARWQWVLMSSAQLNIVVILHIVLSFNMVTVRVSFISCSLSFLTSHAPSLVVGFATWSSRGTTVVLGNSG